MIKIEELTENQRKKLDRALKASQQAAEYLELPLSSVCELMLERAGTREWGGVRKGAGRPPRDWSQLTGIYLPELPLRIAIQKALHQTRFDNEISDFDAFRQILPPGFTAGQAKRLYRSMREAVASPPQAELDRYREHKALRRKRRENGGNQMSD